MIVNEQWSEQVDEFEGAPDDGGIAQQLADSHRDEHNPHIGSHVAQGYANGGTQHGNEGEEAHPRATVLHKVERAVEFFLAHTGISLDPLDFPQVTDVVTRHAAAHVARQRDKQAGDGIHVQRTHTRNNQRLAAERDDAAGEERPQEQAQVTPLGKELDEGV